MLIRTSNDEIQFFDRDKIIDVLIKETSASRKMAEVIAEEVEDEIESANIDYLNTSIVREMVNAKLTTFGLEKMQAKHTSIGVPVFDINKLIFSGKKGENANILHNPESVHKYVADRVFKDFALHHMIPHDVADMHLRGELHVHDLEYYGPRPINCLQHDLRYFISKGLKVDGTGEHTSVAKPPKHMATLMNHSGEIMLAAQQNMSGGQSMSLWNVFAAPFAVGMSLEEVEQMVQMFVFNLNMAYAARGSQVPFTSINLEFGIPDFIKDDPAFGPDGKIIGTYGDYEEEAQKICEAFINVLMKGDAHGKPHLFPNTIFSLRKEFNKPEHKELLLKAHELAAKFGTAYFINQNPKWTGGHSNAMGCRTRLNTNWTGDWHIDTLRTGNLAYISLNLPRLALTNATTIEEKIRHLVEKASEVIRLRKAHGQKLLNDYNLMPFLSQGDSDPYYKIDNATLSIGFVGLNEMVEVLTGYSLEQKTGYKVGLNVVKEINKAVHEIDLECQDNGEYHRWTVLQSPAETTAYRFATLDKKDFGDDAPVKGSKNAVYYTNSSHFPVNTNASLIERIKGESQFHPLTAGGQIFHIWLGEAYPNPESLTSLTEKIAKTDMGFWAYSSAFSFCIDCHNMMRGLKSKCTKCSSKRVEQYDRITGYVQQVGGFKESSGGWNPGKKAELLDRSRIAI